MLSGQALVTVERQNDNDPVWMHLNTGGDRKKMRTLFLSASLFTFWVLLSGHFSTLLLVFGVLSVLLVMWLVARTDRVDREPVVLYPSLGLVGYGSWLMWCVVRSNIDLARRIWDPALPIRPSWNRLDIKVSTPLEKMLYANSITLTPGTLTTDVRDDHFMVHSLSEKNVCELRDGEMERRIRRLGV